VHVTPKQCRDRFALISTDVVPVERRNDVRREAAAVYAALRGEWNAIAKVVGRRCGLRLCGNRVKNLFKGARSPDGKVRLHKYLKP
jgi:hypothetical protein